MQTVIDIQAMLVWLTLPFYDFCGFRSVAVNSVYKLQFFYIYLGNLLKWIGEFLENRTQCVCVGYAMSSPRQLISGVVQGSVLGPLFFLLYVDDVVKLFSFGVLCKLYADDLKLYSIIQTRQVSMSYREALMHL